MKTMIYQRKEWKVIKYPNENNGLYLIRRKMIIDGLTHVSEAEIPENVVDKLTILKAKTHYIKN